MIKFILLLILFETNTFAKDFNSSLAQSNIYYQRPLRLGQYIELPMQNVENLENKNNIKVVVHGYLGNRGHSSIIPVRNAYLSQGTFNLFMADWEMAAEFDYATSRGLIVKVAERFTKILSEFIEKNVVDPKEIHLIGHSLGAHIVGNIGRFFNGSLGRITGLDPALPLFLPQSPDGLQKDDAKFVDVIHTDHPVLGDPTPRGKVDFYPNYGRAPQPGCAEPDLRTFTSCSHYRAVQIYAESVNIPRNFPAIFCSFADILFDKVGRCRRKATLNTTVFMGEYVEKSAIGEYFLVTNSAPPFGQGENSEVYRNYYPEHKP